MQKGFAALELVLVIFIVGVLASCAVPNAVRILDTVSLDYETKRLYTELRFLQSFGRITNMPDSHFGNSEKSQVRLIVFTDKSRVEDNDAANKVYSERSFINGVTASDSKIIRFDDMGKVDPATSDTLKFTSRRGKELYFVFDSVGRFRGSRTKPQ